MIVQVDDDDIILDLLVCLLQRMNLFMIETIALNHFWMNQMFEGFGIFQDMLMIYYDNTIVIHIFKNLVHARIMHIDICHYFIRELIENKSVVIEHVATDMQLVDIFTKVLDASRFISLRKALEICIV